jgi:hypothetical protein
LGAKAELLRAGAALFRLTPVEAARYFRDFAHFRTGLGRAFEHASQEHSSYEHRWQG